MRVRGSRCYHELKAIHFAQGGKEADGEMKEPQRETVKAPGVLRYYNHVQQANELFGMQLKVQPYLGLHHLGFCYSKDGF